MGPVIAGTLWGGRLAGLDPLTLIWQASWVVQLVLLMLAAFSIISWAVIASKWRELRAAESQSARFLDVYHGGSRDAAYEAARQLDASPLSAIFLAAWSELQRMARYAGRAPGAPLEDLELQRVARQLSWVASQEELRLESRLGFLATTGSATPFIGLFGTVIGIINAFTGIGASGSASLAVVAPGIAEALIATAVGLFAAIPATIFYNLFISRLREVHAAIDLFAAELEVDLRRGATVQKAPVRAAGV
jgi:biopolymer transport protein TolQ